MMKSIQPIVLSLVLLLAITSCVPKKKYTQMANLKNSMQDMLDRRNKELEEMKEEMAKLQAKQNDCEEARANLEKDTTALAAQLRKSENSMADLSSNCERLNTNYQQLKAKSTEKMRELVDQLEQLQNDLAQREARLAEVAGRLTDVEARLRQRDSVMNALQSRLADALLGFKKDGLTVEIKNGKVYVSLSNKLLFASGSTKIDKNGQKALADVAAILREQKDITIMVEGHTDDVPVSNLGQIKDNWDLSVMRSTEVVRLLVENGVPPVTLVPSGRGQTSPKAEGSTTEARASNRRTEIIISPKLDELYELVGQK